MAVPVQTLDPTWINAPGGVGPTYDSEELRRNQGFTLAGGATPGTSRTGVLNPRDLVVTLAGSNLMVGPGGAVIGSSKGAYQCGVAAATNIGSFTPADGTNPRRDRIVLEILDPDNGKNVAGARKAQLSIVDGTPNALAASGGGVAAEPGLAITLGFLDVPKAGGGAPVVTALPPMTAAAGAPFPVRTRAEMDAVTGTYKGMRCSRLDLPGAPVATHSGTRWELQPLGHVGRAERRSLAQMTPTLARLHDITAPVEANRVLRVTLRMSGKSTHDNLYADMTFLADGVAFDAGTINFSLTNLGERVEMSGIFVSGPAKPVLFSVNSQIVLPAETPSARVSLPETIAPAPPSMTIHVEDLGPA